MLHQKKRNCPSFQIDKGQSQIKHKRISLVPEELDLSKIMEGDHNILYVNVHRLYTRL